MDRSVLLVFVPLLLLVLVALRIATLRRAWPLGQRRGGVAAGALLSGVLAALASGGSAAAWQSALFAALLGFLAGALVMLVTARWQRGASR
ncbi:MAG: hypothetical protein RMJ05_08080 [Thermomicrobium sp.]|nr:hypothetical protein [Thermomicrobium sp.]